MRSVHSGRFLAVLLLCASLVSADDWPEWRGQDRLGVWRESGIVDRFPESGLQPAWKVEIGSGYSGPVVSGGRVVTLDYRPKRGTETAEAVERVVCLDEETGEQIWVDQWETHYRDMMASYNTGPRATPTIDGDRVYAVGAAGHIRCLNLSDGKLLWSKNGREEFKGTLPVWGISTAPIVHGDLVIFATGGEGPQVRAFDKFTGRESWSAVPRKNYELGYSQFVAFNHAGVRQLIYWDPGAVWSLDPTTGAVLWTVPMRVKHHMSIATPVKQGSRLLVSSFYSGSMLVEMDDLSPTARRVWRIEGEGEKPGETAGLHSVITTPVIQDDYFYGTCSYGEFRGLELETGKRVWEDKTMTRQGRWGSAYLVRHGDRYFMVNDIGELLILKLSPNGPEVVDRTQLIRPDTESGFGPRRFHNSTVNWCHPAFANRHVIIRNDHQMVRVSLAKGGKG